MVRYVSALATAALLAACDGGAEAPHDAPAPTTNAPAAPAEAAANPDLPAVTAQDLANGSENRTLVPSPIETQNALEAAGVDTKLATLVPERKFDLARSDPDYIAIRTGVILADTLLTVVSAETPALVSRLDQVRTGLSSLKAGADLDAQLMNMSDRLKGGSVTRGELLKQFDDLSGAVIPELEFEGSARLVPLIQAGSWLSGANLVAKAIQAKGDPAAADALLKQPAVVAYFLKYVQTEGADKAPAPVTAKLVESLTTLQALSQKTEPLTKDDVATVVRTTDEVLALL